MVGIIGYGRFGRLWADVLRAHHEVLVTDRDVTTDTVSLAELCERCSDIFLCVPINQVEPVVQQLATMIEPGTVVLDTCSVKIHPASVMAAHLGDKAATLIATHPMFGPDSAAKGVHGLPMVVHLLQGDRGVYERWVDEFNKLGMQTVCLSPEEHDRLAAYSQGVTHYVGRVLREMELAETPIDTQGFRILRSLIDQTCNDSWELFSDLQMYNPYTQEMRARMESALEAVNDKLGA